MTLIKMSILCSVWSEKSLANWQYCWRPPIRVNIWRILNNRPNGKNNQTHPRDWRLSRHHVCPIEDILLGTPCTITAISYWGVLEGRSHNVERLSFFQWIFFFIETIERLSSLSFLAASNDRYNDGNSWKTLCAMHGKFSDYFPTQKGNWSQW